MTVNDELIDKVRARGVRVEERLALLREMQADGGPERVAQGIKDLEQRIRTETDRVKRGLR